MIHPDKKLAKRFDLPSRSRAYNELVYSGDSGTREEIIEKLLEDQRKRMPGAPEYNVYFGDIHGHSNLSDGQPSVDEYFINLRDKAKLDFGALSDHDHGGIASKELWDGKWEVIKEKVKEYNEPGKFTTILAYERDSYPWYNNMVVYYDNYDGEMLRGEHPGELTREELHSYLSREDLLLVPHDTSTLFFGTDFLAMDLDDMPPLIQVCARGNYSERMEPQLVYDSGCEGGYWQDALKRGARMGCIACTDDHTGNGGIILEEKGYPLKYPGITGVWAKENTLPAIFEALKARRCYGFMGGRITLDFRINGHYMGEEFTITPHEDLEVYYNIEADGEVDTVTIVKNCRDYIIFQGKKSQLVYDYRRELETDCYYVRAKLKDGRYAWSSPIWVNAK